MFRYECKKIISNKFIIGLFVILFIINALLSYNAAKNSGSYELPEKVLEALEEYNQDPEAWMVEYDRLETYFKEVYYPALLQETWEFYQKNPEGTFEAKQDETAAKYGFYHAAYNYLTELDSYPTDLNRVVEAARSTKEDYLASGMTADDYEYRYQDDIEHIYEVNAIIPVEYEYAKGWDAYHAYTSGNILLVMLMLVLAPGLCIEELSSGMYSVLHATKKGRLHTLICKLGTLLTVVALAVLLFTATTLGFFRRKLWVFLPGKLSSDL